VVTKDSLDTVEMVIAFEEIFGVDLPDPGPDALVGISEIVDWLEIALSKQRPNKAAQRSLRKLAIEQRRPELAEGLDGFWRREQVAAIVHEIFR